ncbi:MAG: FixH family protein [Pseudomonadota bacterium]
MNRDAAETKRQSPWRNPMVWLMVGFPLAAVVAGIATVVIAVRAGGSDAIPDDVRRTAQIQTSELGPDERAAERKLSAVFSVQEDAVEALVATGDFDRTKPLKLSLQHPAEAAQDVALVLQPNDRGGWSAGYALDVGHAWRVQLSDEAGEWRLLGRLPAGQRGVLLRPALGEDPAPVAAAPEPK